jgi:hypothetical protein
MVTLHAVFDIFGYAVAVLGGAAQTGSILDSAYDLIVWNDSWLLTEAAFVVC